MISKESILFFFFVSRITGEFSFAVIKKSCTVSVSFEPDSPKLIKKLYKIKMVIKIIPMIKTVLNVSGNKI